MTLAVRPTAQAALLLAALLATGACARGPEGAGELHAQKAMLEREVAGLREVIDRSERHEPLIPEKDLAVGIDESLLRDLITAQLPFDLDAGVYHIKLAEAEVMFRGAPGVRLHGGLTRSGLVELEAVVEVLGALENISVDKERGVLTAKIAVDHIDIQKAAGVETILSGAALDKVARAIRLQIADKLPPIEIPVKVQQSIELPAVTSGPVRINGARMPIAASVSRVLAGQGRLWVAIHFEPGEIVKTQDAPEAADTRAEDAEPGAEDAAPVKPDAQAKEKPKGKQS
jgi:hypothetical protein